MMPRSSFIAQDRFGCAPEFCLFVFQYEIEYCSFKACEELCWDLNGDCTYFVDCFSRVAIFIMLILPMQEHGRSFHFLISSSISFFKDLKFLSNMSFTCLLVLIQDNILLLAIVKGDLSLISFSAFLFYI